MVPSRAQPGPRPQASSPAPLPAQSAHILLPQRHSSAQAHLQAQPLPSHSTSAATQSPLQGPGHADPAAPSRPPSRGHEASALPGARIDSHGPADTDGQAHPRRLAQPCPATHRPPEPTAAAASRRCRRGRPRSGSPCCGWPSCAPAWASSTGSPGGRGGRPRGFPTPAAPSRAPRGPRRGGQTQAQPLAPPTEVQHPPLLIPKPSPTSLVHGPLPGWGAAYPTAPRPPCWQPPEGDQRVNVL